MLILLSTDLLFASRFHSVARTLAAESQTALSVGQAVAALKAGGVRALYVDLELPGLQIAEFVQQATACGGVPVVAYGPHVHHDRLESARAAGCTSVLSRGEFDRSLPQLLTHALSPGDSSGR